MSLADILAKKKAAAAAAAEGDKAVNATPVAAVEAPVVVAEAKKEEAPAPAAKPLTFAEKMALKKQQAAAPKEESTAQAVEVPALAALSSITERITKTPSAPKDIPIVTDDADLQQKYADIRIKIDDLENRMGEDLKTAMTTLKKALMANPAACEIMLDEDIGEMVKALRRMTMQDVIETKETGGGKKKPKAKTMADLTPEMLAQGLAEL